MSIIKDYQQPSPKISNLIIMQQKETLNKTTKSINIEIDGQSDPKKFKQTSKDDFVTSSVPDADDKKPKSKYVNI